MTHNNDCDSRTKKNKESLQRLSRGSERDCDTNDNRKEKKAGARPYSV
jgi:hypothetical protein